MQAISEGIYYETAYPGVTLGAIILPRGTLMIDAPLRADDARTWKSVLLTQSRGSHRLLVNLDAHADRTLGARALECTVLMHQKTAEIFETRTTVFKGQAGITSAEWEHYADVIGSRWARANLTFTDRIQLHWGDPDIIIEHHPGPTPGSVWVIIPSEKIIFVGDTVTPKQPPFLEDADLPAWFESLNLLTSRKYKDYIIISGRGGITDIESVREQRKLLQSIFRKFESLADKDAPPEATEKLIDPILKSIDYPPRWNDFYAQRLRHGILQYYLNHYFPEELSEEA
jgi:glyoxylase-like metal-dependent hydrolase (beta-lactamase superfamily II)